MILDQTVYHRHILVFQSSFNRLYARVVTPLSLYQQTKNELSLLLFLQLVWPMVTKFICFAAIDDRPRWTKKKNPHTEWSVCFAQYVIIQYTIWYAWHIIIHQSIQNFCFTRRHFIFVLCCVSALIRFWHLFFSPPKRNNRREKIHNILHISFDWLVWFTAEIKVCAYDF